MSEELKPCPHCSGVIREFTGRPKMQWSITFVCQNKDKCGFQTKKTIYRIAGRSQEWWNEIMRTAWNTRTKEDGDGQGTTRL